MADLDVSVLITAGADQLRKELAGVGKEVSGFGQRMSANLNAASQRMIGLGKTMSLGVTGPLAAAGGAALAFTKQFATTGDEIAKTAAKVGLGGQALQELRFAAEQSGVQANTLDMAMQRFSRRLGEAVQGGGELVGTLEEYGIAVTDADGGTRSVEAVFGDLANAIAGADSQSEQLRVAFKAFDSEGAALVNLMRGGSAEVDALRQQFRDLGLGISGEALAASEEFANQWNIVSQQLAAAGTAIGSALLPVIVNDLMPVLIESVIPALISAGEAVGGLIQWFRDLPGPVQSAAGIVATAIGAGGPILLALGVMAKAFAAIIAVGTGPIGLFIAAAGLAVGAWTLWGDQITAVVGGAITWLQETFTAFGEWWGGFWDGFFTGFRERFAAGFAFITESTTAVTEAIKAVWQGVGDFLIFDSLIPGMWEAIEARFAQGAAALEGMSANISNNTTRQFTGMVSSTISQFQTMLAAWDSHSKAMFIASRAAAISQALIATFQGIAEALKWGWPLGPIFAGIIGGIGMAQVAAITATSFGGGGGGGKGSAGSVSGGGSASAIVSAGSIPPQQPAGAAAADQGGRTEISISLEGRSRYTREEIEGLLEQINEALDDNAVLRVRA